MKKFCVRVICFLAIVALLDSIAGVVLDYFRDHARSGRNMELNYIYNEAKPEILILGSSRAYHHYVPSILEDSLLLSCFNAGYNACSIIPMYCRFMSVAGRKKPKVVVYDIYSNNDLLKNNNVDNVNDIRRFCDRKLMREIYEDVKQGEKLKMLSSLYRYNSNINSTLSSFLVESEIKNKGYSPFYSEMTAEPLSIDKHIGELDTQKIEYLEKLIKECKRNGIKIILAISPWYKCTDESEYEIAFDLSRKYNVPLMSYLTNNRLNADRSYFQDQAHLNDVGARIFSSIFAHDLKKMINEID